MVRKVPISSYSTGAGRAWWKCPYCKAGGQKIRTSDEAAERAAAHFAVDHPWRFFDPQFTKKS